VDGLTPRYVDETDWGFGWVASEKSRLGMTSHALATDGRVWLVDPTDEDVALWWSERRVLVCADALGTVPHCFALGGERLGVHPLLRPTPPRGLGRFDPAHILCGHGEGVHDDAARAMRDALLGARRRLPLLLVEPALLLRGGRR